MQVDQVGCLNVFNILPISGMVVDMCLESLELKKTLAKNTLPIEKQDMHITELPPGGQYS